MKIGEKLNTPTNENYIKKLTEFNGTPYYSFLFNKSKKNKQTGEYEIIERYQVNVMNLTIFTNMEIQITKILDAKPQTMKSRDGRDFLNCVIYIEADNVTKNNNQTNYEDNLDKILQDIPPKNNNNNNIYDDSEDDLPF